MDLHGLDLLILDAKRSSMGIQRIVKPEPGSRKLRAHKRVGIVGLD